VTTEPGARPAAVPERTAPPEGDDDSATPKNRSVDLAMRNGDDEGSTTGAGEGAGAVTDATVVLDVPGFAAPPLVVASVVVVAADGAGGTTGCGATDDERGGNVVGAVSGATVVVVAVLAESAGSVVVGGGVVVDVVVVGGVVVVVAAATTLNDIVCCVAATHTALPDWAAVTVHVPGARRFAVEPVTEHTPGVVEAHVMGRPEEIVAASATVPPTVPSAAWVTVIDWFFLNPTTRLVMP